jgi:hypothetical protein
MKIKAVSYSFLELIAVSVDDQVDDLLDLVVEHVVPFVFSNQILKIRL